MYQANTPAGKLSQLVWSPFLHRSTRWSDTQWAIATAATRNPGMTQRDIAARVGCSQSTVSKTLALMKRLGVLAVSTTRGCLGKTVAWVRRGVSYLGRANDSTTTETVSPSPVQEFLSTLNVVESFREGSRA